MAYIKPKMNVFFANNGKPIKETKVNAFCLLSGDYLG